MPQVQLSPQVIKFLTLPENNLQQGEVHLEFNALALLLHDFKETYKKPWTFICGGSEDLDALLGKLSFSESQNEAFILVRPYIHSMGLYFCYENGEINCFFFDSQNWGMRFYPSRNILAIIKKHYPSIHLVSSEYEIQPQRHIGGCNELSLLFLECCAKNGSSIFAEYSSKFEQKPLPTILSTFLQVEEEENCQQKITRIERSIKELLRKFNDLYISKFAQDADTIPAIIQEMQGLNISAPLYSVSSMRYEIKKNNLNCQLIIEFRDSNHYHHNDLFLYNPKAKFCQENTKVNTLFDKLKGISVIRQDDDHKLILQAKNARLLRAAIEALKSPQALAQQVAHYRHQRLAIATFIQDIKIQMDLLEIKDSGMGFDQVNKALKYLLREKNGVFVYTDIFNLSSQNENLALLIKNSTDKPYFVVSFGVKNNETPHQIALIADQQNKTIILMDSLNKEYNENIVIKELRDSYKIQYQQTISVQDPNTADCGLHVIENVTSFFQISFGSVREENYAYQCLIAGLNQNLIEESLTNQFQTNFKRRILDTLEEINEAPKNKENRILEPYIKLLQEEFTINGMPTEEWKRTRSLQEMLSDFYRREPQLPWNHIILFESLCPLEKGITSDSELSKKIKDYISLFIESDEFFAYHRQGEQKKFQDCKLVLELDLTLELKLLSSEEALKELDRSIANIFTKEGWGLLKDSVESIQENYIKEVNNNNDSSSCLYFLALFVCLKEKANYHESLATEIQRKKGEKYQVEQQERNTLLAQVAEQKEQFIQTSLSSVGVEKEFITKFLNYHRSTNQFYQIFKDTDPQVWPCLLEKEYSFSEIEELSNGLIKFNSEDDDSFTFKDWLNIVNKMKQFDKDSVGVCDFLKSENLLKKVLFSLDSKMLVQNIKTAEQLATYLIYLRDDEPHSLIDFLQKFPKKELDKIICEPQGGVGVASIMLALDTTIQIKEFLSLVNLEKTELKTIMQTLAESDQELAADAIVILCEHLVQVNSKLLLQINNAEELCEYLSYLQDDSDDLRIDFLQKFPPKDLEKILNDSDSNPDTLTNILFYLDTKERIIKFLSSLDLTIILTTEILNNTYDCLKVENSDTAEAILHTLITFIAKVNGQILVDNTQDASQLANWLNSMDDDDRTDFLQKFTEEKLKTILPNAKVLWETWNFQIFSVRSLLNILCPQHLRELSPTLEAMHRIIEKLGENDLVKAYLHKLGSDFLKDLIEEDKGNLFWFLRKLDYDSYGDVLDLLGSDYVNSLLAQPTLGMGGESVPIRPLQEIVSSCDLESIPMSSLLQNILDNNSFLDIAWGVSGEDSYRWFSFLPQRKKYLMTLIEETVGMTVLVKYKNLISSNVNKTDAQGNTLALIAAKAVDGTLLAGLEQLGANLNQSNRSRKTPAMVLLKHNISLEEIIKQNRHRVAKSGLLGTSFTSLQQGLFKQEKQSIEGSTKEDSNLDNAMITKPK